MPIFYGNFFFFFPVYIEISNKNCTGKLKYVVPSAEDFNTDPYLQAPHLIHYRTSSKSRG